MLHCLHGRYQYISRYRSINWCQYSRRYSGFLFSVSLCPSWCLSCVVVVSCFTLKVWSSFCDCLPHPDCVHLWLVICVYLSPVLPSFLLGCLVCPRVFYPVCLHFGRYRYISWFLGVSLFMGIYVDFVSTKNINFVITIFTLLRFVLFKYF